MNVDDFFLYYLVFALFYYEITILIILQQIAYFFSLIKFV